MGKETPRNRGFVQPDSEMGGYVTTLRCPKCGKIVLILHTLSKILRPIDYECSSCSPNDYNRPLGPDGKILPFIVPTIDQNLNHDKTSGGNLKRGKVIYSSKGKKKKGKGNGKGKRG